MHGESGQWRKMHAHGSRWFFIQLSKFELIVPSHLFFQSSVASDAMVIPQDSRLTVSSVSLIP
jgi:hypothetical protein